MMVGKYAPRLTIKNDMSAEIVTLENEKICILD